MEWKYRYFLNYDFEGDEKYHQYINSIEPPASPDKIDFYKRKYYKLHIDPDFDIHYAPKPNSQILRSSTAIQLVFFILFLISFYYSYPKNQIYYAIPLSIASIIGLVKKYGYSKLITSYWNRIIVDDNFHNLLWTLIFIITYRSFFLIWLPLIIRSTIFITECFNIMSRKGNSLAQLIDYIGVYIVTYKEYLILFKNIIEIALCLILPYLMFKRGTGYIIPLFYWQIFLIKYLLNESLRNSIQVINSGIEKGLDKFKVLSPIKWLYGKLKGILSWIVRVITKY